MTVQSSGTPPPKARRYGSRPSSILLGKEQVQGYFADFQLPSDGVQTILSMTPVQQDLYRDASKTSWLAVIFSLPPDSSVSIDKIQFTWQAVAAHHPILRTVVTNSGPPSNEPILIVLRNASTLSFCAGPYPSVTRLDELHPPRLVFGLCENGEPNVTMYIPRVLVDETAVRLIRNDWVSFYSGRGFAECTSFRSYVEDVQSRDSHSAGSYWQAILEGVHHDPPLFSPSATPSSERKRYTVSTDSDVLDRVKIFNVKTGFHLASIFQAAWVLVLTQHQSREDIVFAVSTRDDAWQSSKAAPIVGQMELTFPVRVQASRDTKTFTLLEELQLGMANGKKHGYVGFERILHQSESSALQIQSSIKLVDSSDGSVFCIGDDDFPLSLRVTLSDAIYLTVRCDSSVPDLKIRVMLDHCLQALESILAADSSTAVGDTDLIGADEEAFILEKAIPVCEPMEDLVHVLFERQSEISPNAIAVEDENGDLVTYSELNSAANRIARLLPCSPGTIVPLCMNRSIAFIVSLLAILKSGAAYVIIDPEYPTARQRFIVKDVRAQFVLTEAAYSGRFESKCLVFEHLAEQSSSSANIRIQIAPSQAAYIIYTSGSTGTPRGVILEHGAVTSGLLSAPRIEGVRTLLFYNPVFSAAQRTIFGCLTQGGTLCLASKERLSVSLSDIVTKMNVNTLGTTSTTLSLLSPDVVTSLTTITLTGEMITPDVADTWAGKLDLRSGYGLSECTQLIWTQRLRPGCNPNNIGRPSDTTSSYILIPNTTRLAPILVPGELCLSGPQLARSYLNAPEQSSRAFIDNPFGHGRLYRTGDMAVCLEDGSVQILGRIDMQVKIAGQRLEPAEVAAVLRQHHNVNSAAVVPIPLQGETSLVACLVLAPPDSVWTRALADELREHCAKSLPSFAVPSYWLITDVLPTTGTGKIDYVSLKTRLEGLDRQALIRLSLLDHGTTTDGDRSPSEQTLREIWASVLELEIGMIDSSNSFLALGGSSIRAIQVVSACRQNGWDISVADVIRAKSLKDLAGLVETTSFSLSGPQYQPFSLLDTDVSLTDENFKDFDDVYPASPLQEALVAASLSGSTDYLYQRVYSIHGVDLPRLKDAMQSVFSIDAMVRTTFISGRSELLQAVLKCEIPFEERYEPLEEYKLLDAVRGVALGQPFCRVAVLPKDSLLILTMHHSLFDYWSNNFFLDDSAVVYLGGSPTTRPSYTSFIRHVVNTDAEVSRSFWREYLRDASPTKLASQPYPQHIVERELHISINHFLSTYSVTSGALIYAAWALVLAAHMASNEVTFGTTLSGRDVPISEAQSMNGPTLTSVPQRVFVDGNQAALEFVRAVQDSFWEMNRFSQFGLRNALRAAGHSNELFDTLVNLLVDKEIPSLTQKIFQPYGAKPVWSTEFISLEVILSEEKFVVHLTSHLEPLRSKFILDQFVNVLAGIVSSPHASLSAIELVGEAESKHLMAMSPPVAPSVTHLMHEPCERHAAVTPHRIAVQYECSEYVSYKQLNSRANRLAAILRIKGVGPEVVVPFCLEKSAKVIVCMLGVLKAGGAFTALDPENPPERNSFIVADVEANLVLTDRDHAEIFTNLGVEVILVDELDLSGMSPNIPSAITPDTLAYVIYTSGSTGLPKGVLVPHSAATHALKSMIEIEGCDPNWRVLQFSNYTFDMSTLEIFTTLTAGGTLCVAPMSELLADLAGCMNSMGVTQTILTPTVGKLISPESVPDLAQLILGGEALTPDLIATWAPKLELLNAYGPTEAAMTVSMVRVAPGGSASIIGKPYDTTSAVILQPDSLQPVPYGAIGELCIAGPQLARGYLKRPETNELAFVNYRGRRLYRTGDLARWQPDGLLECLGRKDRQVKVAGHRIELGEIEHAILATKKVVNNHVLEVKVQGKKRLAAFVIFDSPDNLGDTIFLSPMSHADEIMSINIDLNTLPPYMVPQIWIPVSRFPLMPSGKTDSNMLTRMVQDLDPVDLSLYSSGGPESEEYVTPESDEEKTLQTIWASVLRVDIDVVGANSSFLSFGGDSISAIQLVGECRKAGYTLPIGDVMAFPLLREMSTRIKPDSAVTQIEEAAPVYKISSEVYASLHAAGVEKEEIATIIPSGPGQSEFSTFAQTDNQAWQVQVVRPLPADLDFPRWLQLTTRLTQLNPILRTMYLQDHDNTWLQVVLKKPDLDFAEIHVKDDAEMEQKIDEDWDRPFALGKPAIRYRLFVLPDARRSLMINMDHASYDGTLLRIFDSQFTSMARNRPMEQPVSFHSFVDHVQRRDKSNTLEFWGQFLDENKFSWPKLPSDIRPLVSQALLRKIDQKVDAFASRCGVTVPIVLLSAYTILLSRLSGSFDVSYDNLVSGRDIDMSENTQLINGCTANFLPFRSSFTPSTTVRELLKETQSVFWRTIENGTVNLSDIYGPARQERMNKCLFVFQPFEPGPSGEVDHMRWLVMALSKVKQPIPYALMLEVSKSVVGYKIGLKFDGRVFGEEAREDIANKLLQILQGIMDKSRAPIQDLA